MQLIMRSEGIEESTDANGWKEVEEKLRDFAKRQLSKEVSFEIKGKSNFIFSADILNIK